MERVFPRPRYRLLVRCRNDRKVPPLVICSAHRIREQWLAQQEIKKLRAELSSLRSRVQELGEG
jgi:hypothetical protein